MLNPASPIPLYRQLAELLLGRIQAGDFATGGRIPSEPKLAARFGIGRPTVRQAVELLVRRGLLERRRGSGTFVRPQPAEVDLFSLAGTLAAFDRQGIAVQRQLLQAPRRITVSPDPANPFAGRKAYFISRLSQVDDAPVLLEEMFLHPELFSGIERFDLGRQSLSAIVAENYYMRPVGGRQSFRIGAAVGRIAAHLGLSEGAPMLMVVRTLHFQASADAFFAMLYCRTDRFVFAQNLGGLQNG
jgi:GntR family transcriptional regulator